MLQRFVNTACVHRQGLVGSTYLASRGDVVQLGAALQYTQSKGQFPRLFLLSCAFHCVSQSERRRSPRFQRTHGGPAGVYAADSIDYSTRLLQGGIKGAANILRKCTWHQWPRQRQCANGGPSTVCAGPIAQQVRQSPLYRSFLDTGHFVSVPQLKQSCLNLALMSPVQTGRTTYTLVADL